jgi:glutamate/tyrosine decarboxylase-like PLP-dependent enzyme
MDNKHMNFFNRHYRSINENYFQHLKFSFKQGCILIIAGFAAILHAFVPFILTTFGSRTTHSLSSRFKRRMAGHSVKNKIIIDEFIPLMDHYLKNLKSEPVVHYLKPEDLSQQFDLTLPQDGLSNEALLQQITQYLSYCVHTGNHQFFNQLWSGFDAIGFTAEMLIALTNTSMYTYDVAPVATLIELSLIKRLAEMLGFPATHGGTFVTGGSNGNLIAMLAARNRSLAAHHNPDDLCVIYSDNAHYSMDTAAMILGIKENNIFKIAHTPNQALSVEALKETLERIRALKKIPFFVAATAGTTVAGAFDPVEAIAAITADYCECWLHIDAAHGGAVLFSPEHQARLKGCELADSFIWDAHKTLGAPLVCSVLLVRDKQHLIFHEEQSAAHDYLYHKDQDHQLFDLGHTSIQCGRRADCLKLWLMWQRYGTTGIGQYVDHLMNLTAYAAQWVSQHQDFELLGTPEYLNICFRYKPAGHEAFYYQIKKALHINEKTMVNIAKMEGQNCFRLVVSNKQLTTQDIDTFFSTLLGYCSAMTASLP